MGDVSRPKEIRGSQHAKRGDNQMLTKSNFGKVMSEYGAVIIGVFAVLIGAVGFFVKPSFTVDHHVIVVSQGISLTALLFGGYFWAFIEILTPPGKGIFDALWRPIAGYFLGAIVGGLFGYLLNVGEFLVIPAHSGNMGALFLLIVLFFAFVMLIADAVWSHDKRYIAS